LVFVLAFMLLAGSGVVGPAPAAQEVPAPDVAGWLRGLLAAGRTSTSFAGVPQPKIGGVPEPAEAGVAGAAPARRVPPPVVRVRELARERTATARFFELSDGRRQAEVTSSPEAYLDGEGRWRPVDTRLRGIDEPGFRYGNRGNRFASRFGDRSDRLARFEFAGGSVTVGTTGQPRAVVPVAEGDTATFQDVFPRALGDADVRYRVAAEGLKEEIVLERPPTAADPSYTFSLRLAGVDATASMDGSIRFFRSGAGGGEGPLFVIPKPFMTDASPDLMSPYGKVWSDQVTQTVTQRGSRIELTVSPDQAWLTSPDRQYPVVIDPTIIVEPTPTTGQDAMIRSTTSTTRTTNYGTSWQLGVGTDATGAARSLLKFDVSWIPPGTLIDAADLKVWYDQGYFTNANSVSLQAHRITTSWSESTVTWSNFTGGSGEQVGSPVTKSTFINSRWHGYNLKSLVTTWVDGTVANHGVMLRATNETTLGKGGAYYEAAEYAYNGGIVNRPKLVITYGKPGVAVDPITTIYSTGAELSWSTYVDPSSATGDDMVEYQVHRHIHQRFTPTAATLVAPVSPGTTSFTDTSAPATAADAPTQEGNAYYYQVAVKTKDGSLVPSSTRLTRLPKAGRITKIVQGTALDTTLSSDHPTTNYDVFDNEPWLSAGDNGGSYGRTRTLVKFPNLNAAVPTGATVVNADLMLWKPLTFGSGAVFDLYALTRDFSETTATWNRASSTTPWTTPGGDYNPTLVDYVPTMTNDPKWHIWWIDALAQQWVNTPSSNKGALIRTRAESTANQLTVFNSNELASEPLLRPRLDLTYLEKTAESTYYAPYTPSRMIPGDQYTVEVTLTNTTASTWTTLSHALSYHWELPDGTDATTSGNRLDSPLPEDVSPGETVVVQAQVRTPIQSAAGNKREAFVLKWDLRNKVNSTWLSDTGGVPALAQNVAVEDPTSDQLGLEKFYSYAGTSTGAGSAAMVNQAAGNLVWSYDAFANPSRGPSTFLRFAYNSLDTSTSSAGFGWSVSASSVMRLGSPLDLHPRGQDWPTEVTLIDGDGTSHFFSLDKHGSSDPADWEYDSAAGVHLFLEKASGTDPTRAWVMTRPDRTRFFFDTEGYQTATVDNNGNTLTFTYHVRQSNNKPTKFLAYLTDATNRQTLTLDYYRKSDAYEFIDDAGNPVAGSNLTNPHIIDQLRSVTDLDGRRIELTYTDKGLMARLVDGAGTPEARTFRYGYDMLQGNKNVKLVGITDPRGNTTDLAYYDPPPEPKFHWWTQSVTDRRGGLTELAYLDPDGPAGSVIETTVTDAEGHATRYTSDGFGRPTEILNAKGQLDRLAWDADNNVVQHEENNGAIRTWTYDQDTGYPLTIRDAEANANGTPATVLTYQTGLDGHIADLISKASPEGRSWAFEYDAVGNLTAVTDPAGTATPEPDDFTTSYTYDQFGQLLTATDPNGNTTGYAGYQPVGYPETITDALDNDTTTTYDARGNVTSVTDARGKTSTMAYDVFSRPLEMVTPKDQAAGQFITTPAPVYDGNDNVVAETAPNGAVTTVAYDPADRPVEVALPQDMPGGPARVMAMVYDDVGNLVSETEPKGSLTPGDPDDFVTRYTYDEVYQLVELTDADGGRFTQTFDDVGNVVEVVDGRKNQTADPGDYTVRSVYDLRHQVVEEIDAAGHPVSYQFDRDGMVVATTDQEGVATELTRDERGLVTEIKVPHQAVGGTTTFRTTRFAYDQAGNQVATITPRGVETASEPDDFVQRTVYDALNRPVEEVYPFDPNDPEHDTPAKTVYSYDEVGNLVTVSAPPSGGQGVRNDTVYDHFDTGWVRAATDPWEITTSYDYNLLGQQVEAAVTSAGGSQSRSIGWDYFPDGKLRSRSDSGVPFGRHVVLVDNSDLQHTTATGTWSTVTSGDDFQGFDYRTHTAGGPGDTFRWRLTVPAGGDYEVFVRYAAGTATDAPYTVAHAGGGTTVDVDQTQQAGQWVSLGSFDFDEGIGHDVTLAPSSAGTVVADAVKLVRDASGETDTEQKSIGYAYDVNGNLVRLVDTSEGAVIDEWLMSYDVLNRVAEVEERAGGLVEHTTGFSYDATGNPLTRTHDGATAALVYDVRDAVTSVTHTEPGVAPKVSTFAYTRKGKVDVETAANGNTVAYGYFLDGLVRSQVEKRADGTVVNEHTLTYTANSQLATDHARTQDADSHSQLLERTYTYGYDPRDRLVGVSRTAVGGGGQQTQTYLLDDNGNTVSQTVAGLTTNYTYDRNRLLSATAVGGSSSAYNYDPYGRLDTVVSAGAVVEKYTYDGFDRTVAHRAGTGTAAKTTTYGYDPFDRTLSRTSDAGGTEEETTSFAYLGVDAQVAAEQVDGQLSRTYQYGAHGERLSMLAHDQGGSPEFSVYGYDTRGNVELITDPSGNARASYGYTAYGSPDADLMTGLDAPDPGDPDKDAYNTFRFQAKQLDPATGNYDMGARDYDPGLNRFLSRDMYAGALSDLGLVTDPFTMNRYAFAGGNPLSRVEFGGHFGWSDLGHAVLDVVGLVPVVGEAADLANAAWYAAEGDYANAALSAAAAVPFVGWGASAVKAGRYIYKGVDAARSGSRYVDEAADVAGATRRADTPTRSGPDTPSAPREAGATPRDATTPTQSTPAPAPPPKPGGQDVLFGQKRIGPNFSPKGTFQGRSVYDVAGDIRSGRLRPEDVVVHAFRHGGQLIAENNRSLAALSLAGHRPVNVKILGEVADDVLARLDEVSPLGDRLPSRRVAVTPSQADLRIMDVVHLPGG
jgi:RHS repeat-associated protein